MISEDYFQETIFPRATKNDLDRFGIIDARMRRYAAWLRWISAMQSRQSISWIPACAGMTVI